MVGGRGEAGRRWSAVGTHHTYEKEGRYFSPKPQTEGVPNMKLSGRDSENTGSTASKVRKPMMDPTVPSGVVPRMVLWSCRVVKRQSVERE